MLIKRLKTESRIVNKNYEFEKRQEEFFSHDNEKR